MPTEQHRLKWWSTPFNLASTRQNFFFFDCWEVGDLFYKVEVPETSEEQDHNMWNEGLNLITEQNTGLSIQSCLSDEEFGSSGNQQPLRGGLPVCGAVRLLRRSDKELRRPDSGNSPHRKLI